MRDLKRRPVLIRAAFEFLKSLWQQNLRHLTGVVSALAIKLKHIVVGPHARNGSLQCKVCGVHVEIPGMDSGASFADTEEFCLVRIGAWAGVLLIGWQVLHVLHRGHSIARRAKAESSPSLRDHFVLHLL